MEGKSKYTHVFVLSSGRTGTMSLSRACEHIKNYSCAHESLSQKIGKDRLAYPQNHIEIDNRLSWILGRVDEKFGKEAFYVHMKRNPEKVAQSYLKRQGNSAMLSAYHAGVLKRLDRITIKSARDIVYTINKNIDAFLKDKPNKMEFQLENAEEDLRTFFDSIGADVNLSKAIGEMKKTYNKSTSESRMIRKLNAAKIFIKYRVLNKTHEWKKKSSQ